MVPTSRTAVSEHGGHPSSGRDRRRWLRQLAWPWLPNQRTRDASAQALALKPVCWWLTSVIDDWPGRGPFANCSIVFRKPRDRR
jgi:hypothetical protein